jgi:cytochrome c553
MRRWAIVIVMLVSANSVRAQVPAPADLEFFESKVRPILVERCQVCHAATVKKRNGKLHLDSHSAILKGGESGPALAPGDPDKSLLIAAIRYGKEDLQMPPKGKLPAREIAVLEEWIRRGAIYPGPAGAIAKEAGIDWAKGRKFWSFQSPKEAALPEVRAKAWPKRRADAFILAELEKRGLAPSKAAERRVLIRRATFDLIGLPPTPDEVEAFVNDKTPDVYDRLIDRLLAAPQYGERWARFWLDLARYCDIPEAWADGKGQPWLYRDWVVQAFNDDLPYDQFVQQQLAADLLPGSAPRDRAALGFLGLSPSYWKELQLDKDVIKGVVAEEWEERIHTLGATFLGLTVACARCHDHKFDPISAEDYYALAGVFASIKHTDVSILADAEARAVQEAIAKVQALQAQLKKADKSKVAELNAQIATIKKETPLYDTSLARGVVEASLYVLPDGPSRTKLDYKVGVGQDVPMQIRGNPANPGPTVPRRFLTVLSPESPAPFKVGSGRLELARAVVNEGAPLAGRVIVNRIWKQHFGSGLVETPSDFGVQGARPTHPELLDDLTARFLKNGWSLKWLHREIMLSAAYQQASTHDERKATIDPDNRWLWRMSRRRLEVEAWRDAMLSVSGTLNLVRGGRPLDLADAKNQRRTLYGIVKRRELNDMLRLFDFPDPITHSAARLPTTTPLQQLFTLNSPLLRQQSAALVQRLKKDAPDEDARIRRAYLLLFGRPATDNQVRVGREFLGNAPGDEAWLQYAHALLASNEFLFVD